MTNPPNPKSGYREKNKLGDPKDKSSMATILARHRILKQSKKDWRSVMNKAGITKSLDKATGGLSVLVVQNVLPPKQTNHRTGWALDIKGRPAKKDNPDIIRISKGLGATLTYDEAFHIHVEFEGGVKGGGTLPASVASDPVPQSEIGEAVVEESPAREAAWWDPSELLKTTGKGWSKILSDFF
jgi:hypothetical protein